MSIQQNFPAITPSLSLNFARSKTLDPRITFSRTTTATRVNEQGLVEVVSADIPRFDHEYENGVIKSLGLLVEESRSNLVTYSSDMSQWTDNGSPIYADNDTTAPDGTLTADKLTENNAAANGRWIEVTISANTTYTVASFIKPTDQPRTRIGVYSNVGSWYGNVDTDWDANGEPTTQNSVGASNIKYEPYPNGWYRVSFQFTSPSTINGTIEYFHMPDRIASGKSAWFWGAQLEAGAFPTSYIPTSGSTATRNPDTVTMTGDNFSDWYNQEQGSIVWIGRVYTKEEPSLSAFRINRTDGGNLRGMAMQIDTRYSNNNNTINFMSRTQSSNIPSKVASVGIVTSTSTIKLAGGYIESVGLSTIRAAFNGDPENSYAGASQTDVVDGAMNELEIMGERGTSGTNNYFTGVCEQLVYYPRIFTDDQLQNLTK